MIIWTAKQLNFEKFLLCSIEIRINGNFCKLKFKIIISYKMFIIMTFHNTLNVNYYHQNISFKYLSKFSTFKLFTLQQIKTFTCSKLFTQTNLSNRLKVPIFLYRKKFNFHLSEITRKQWEISR